MRIVDILEYPDTMYDSACENISQAVARENTAACVDCNVAACAVEPSCAVVAACAVGLSCAVVAACVVGLSCAVVAWTRFCMSKGGEKRCIRS